MSDTKRQKLIKKKLIKKNRLKNDIDNLGERKTNDDLILQQAIFELKLASDECKTDRYWLILADLLRRRGSNCIDFSKNLPLAETLFNECGKILHHFHLIGGDLANGIIEQGDLHQLFASPFDLMISKFYSELATLHMIYKNELIVPINMLKMAQFHASRWGDSNLNIELYDLLLAKESVKTLKDILLNCQKTVTSKKKEIDSQLGYVEFLSKLCDENFIQGIDDSDSDFQ